MMQLTRLPDEGDVRRIEISERIVQGDATPQLDQVDELLGGNGFSGNAVLSLTETECIDTSGLWWLLVCHKRFCESGGKLVIHSIPPHVMDTLMMMRLELVLNLAEDESAAMELLQETSNE